MSGGRTGDRNAPRHVAIIMDGNGRWARRRGRRRVIGHRVGATVARRVTESARRMGLEQLTLFTFSTENWRRPEGEVNFLMRLFRRFLRSARASLREKNIRLRVIGVVEELPRALLAEVRRSEEFTRSCDGMTLCLAMNYGGRREIVESCRRLVRLAREGMVRPEDVDEAAIEAGLFQPDMPPPDLIIRTGGEQRLSNFLLWQAAYAEIWTTPVCWPDFREEHLQEAVAAYRKRERRFGGVLSAVGEETGEESGLTGRL